MPRFLDTLFQNQPQVPSQLVSDIIAHDGGQLGEAGSPRQHSLKCRMVERSEHDSELLLSAPDPRSERGRDTETTAIPRRSEAPTMVEREIDPLANNLFDPS